MNNGNTQRAEQEKFGLPTAAFNELFAGCINTTLEMEMAFKLHSFRVTTHEQFISRVLDLADFINTLNAKIQNNGETQTSSETLAVGADDEGGKATS